jgi:membrane-associated phospholipid phosphatase
MRFILLPFVFILFSITVHAQNWDINTLRSINVHRNTSLDKGFTFVTNSVTPFAIGAPLITLGYGLIARDTSTRNKGLMILESYLLSAGITVIMKATIKRERPFNTYPEIEKLSPGGSYSFSSGHTSSAFANATALTFAFPKWYVAAPSFLWAGAIGYSRMHLGVHYPSDVIVGAAIGAGSAWLCHYLNQRWIFPYRKMDGVKL